MHVLRNFTPIIILYNVILSLFLSSFKIPNIFHLGSVNKMYFPSCYAVQDSVEAYMSRMYILVNGLWVHDPDIGNIRQKQAGAELFQAQDKLGLANPALSFKKLKSSSNWNWNLK